MTTDTTTPERLGHKTLCLDEYWPAECVCDTERITDTICHHPKTGWHRTDRIMCEEWDGLVKHTRDQYGAEYIMNGYGHSDARHFTYDREEAKERAAGQECVKALAEYTAKQGWNWPIVIASGAEDPNEIATKIVQDNPQWFGELPDGTYQTLEADVLRRQLDDEKLRAKYWHKEYLAQRRRWWWAVSFAAVCAASTGTVLAWAGVL